MAERKAERYAVFCCTACCSSVLESAGNSCENDCCDVGDEYVALNAWSSIVGIVIQSVVCMSRQGSFEVGLVGVAESFAHKSAQGLTFSCQLNSYFTSQTFTTFARISPTVRPRPAYLGLTGCIDSVFSAAMRSYNQVEIDGLKASIAAEMTDFSCR